MKDLVAVGKKVGMDKARCERIAREIEECVWYDLKEYLR